MPTNDNATTEDTAKVITFADVPLLKPSTPAVPKEVAPTVDLPLEGLLPGQSRSLTGDRN